MLRAGILLGSAVALFVTTFAGAVVAPSTPMARKPEITTAYAVPNPASGAEPAVPAAQPAVDERVVLVEELYAGRPLQAYARLMVETADRYGIDWRLMPTIGFMESGAGVAACGGNAWGYAACKVTFATFEEGIERVAQTLAAYPYAGESTATILCIWQSGGGCTTHGAVHYAHTVMEFYAALGGTYALPPYIPAPGAGSGSAPPPAVTNPADPTPESQATPAATPETSPEAVPTEAPADSGAPGEGGEGVAAGG